jgi:hypothetical protein
MNSTPIEINLGSELANSPIREKFGDAMLPGFTVIPAIRGALKIRIFSYAKRLGDDSPNVAERPKPAR